MKSQKKLIGYERDKRRLVFPFFLHENVRYGAAKT
jgi:hypothetical protein